MLSPPRWEEVYDRTGDSLSRMKVPGGWLVSNTTCRVEYVDSPIQPGTRMAVEAGDYKVSMCFLPDPNHEWLKEPRDYGDDDI